MKLYKLILLMLIITSNIPCYALIYGTIDQDIISGNAIDHFPLHYASDQQMYTNGVGGITFTYPAGWFTQAPMVQASVMQNIAHPATETYVAEVSNNTTTSTTVMIYVVNAGVVSEAPTGSVIVNIWSVDIPL